MYGGTLSLLALPKLRRFLLQASSAAVLFVWGSSSFFSRWTARERSVVGLLAVLLLPPPLSSAGVLCPLLLTLDHLPPPPPPLVDIDRPHHRLLSLLRERPSLCLKLVSRVACRSFPVLLLSLVYVCLSPNPLLLSVLLLLLRYSFIFSLFALRQLQIDPTEFPLYQLDVSIVNTFMRPYYICIRHLLTYGVREYMRYATTKAPFQCYLCLLHVCVPLVEEV